MRGADMMITQDYKAWLGELRAKIRQSQIKAAVKVNEALLRLYWNMGSDIAERQLESAWGSGFFEQLSRDLKQEFPEMRGFSVSNLKYIKRFYLFYAQNDALRHQVGDELEDSSSLGVDAILSIPWRHHVELLSKCKSVDEALFYVGRTLEHGWSRNVLMNMLETHLYESQGNAQTNFKTRLPAPMSDLAEQTLKDPYCFDFLSMREDYDERDLENALVENITRFLLALGSGFAYVGRQMRMTVGTEEFAPDLLFYHLKLRCYIVVELKTGKFEPEYLGKLGFYVSAVNNQLKHPDDAEAIGLLICKSKDRVVAEYSLQTTNQALGISEYKLEKFLPDNLRTSLPSIAEIESELNKNGETQERI